MPDWEMSGNLTDEAKCRVLGMALDIKRKVFEHLTGQREEDHGNDSKGACQFILNLTISWPAIYLQKTIMG